MLRSLDEIRGYKIHATDGEIGRVDDFYFDDISWTIRYLVVDTGPWLFGRKVLISPVALGQPDWVGRVLPVSLSKEQVENSPDVELDQPVSRQKQEALHQHYGWDTYWLSLQAGTASGVPPAPAAPAPVSPGAPPDEEEQEGADIEDPHLRSSEEVINYRIQALDGEFGRADDFIADDVSWVIRYMVVDTGNWLSSERVLIAPPWVTELEWAGARVHVGMDKESIENSPEYDPSKPINREYEVQLYDYYGRPVYWDE